MRWGRRRNRGAGRRDVCRQGGRGGAGRRAVRPAAPPLYARLIRSIRAIDRAGRKERLAAIAGIVPSLLEPAPGCRFAARCESRCRSARAPRRRCARSPPTMRSPACYEPSRGRSCRRRDAAARQRPGEAFPSQKRAVVAHGRTGTCGRGVSFDIGRGETLGLVGESGAANRRPAAASCA